MGHIIWYLSSTFLMLYNSSFFFLSLAIHFHVKSLWRVRKSTYKRFVRLLKQITRIFMAIALLRLKRRISIVVLLQSFLCFQLCAPICSCFRRSLVRIDKRKKLSSSFQPLVFTNSKTSVGPLTFPNEFLCFFQRNVNPVCSHSFPANILFQQFNSVETEDFCTNRKCILIVSHNNNIRCYTQ